jgi:transcriptional regulator with GAF, ATPase, and Fis domain
MMCVNCAALANELIESELFGHEKGAFTGAHDRRKGRFELADGGTLFLDEIGEISGGLQAKLLRVIQEGEFERLGGSRTLRTDVRLITATNRDLQRAVDSGNFRADLYYRINSFPIHMPTLRDRKEDIPLLAEHLVRKHAGILSKNVESISARTLCYLQEQSWPGNIRELEGTILRALISTPGPVLDYIGAIGETEVEAPDSLQAGPLSLLEAQRNHIVDALEQTNWVIEGKAGAASVLGLAPSSLRSKMKRLDIVRPH